MERMFFATLATAAALAGGQALVPSPAAAMDEAGGDSGSATTCPLSQVIWDADTDHYICDTSKEGGGDGSGSTSGGSSGAGTQGGGSGAGPRSGGSGNPGRDGGVRSSGYFDLEAALAGLRDMREACLGLWRRIERADRDEDDVQRRNGQVSRARGTALRKKWTRRGCDNTYASSD